MSRKNFLHVLMIIAVSVSPLKAWAQGETTSAIVGRVVDPDQCSPARRRGDHHESRHGFTAGGEDRRGRPVQFSAAAARHLLREGGGRGFQPQRERQRVRGSGAEADGQFHAAPGALEADRGGERRSAADQSGKREHLHHAERAGPGKSAESGRRPDLSAAVCRRRADQYGGQRQ